MPDKLLYIILAGASMLGVSILLLVLGRRQAEREEVIRRLDEEGLSDRESARRRYPFWLRWIYHNLQRAGIVNRPVHLVLVAMIWLLVAVAAMLLKGVIGLLTALVLLAAGFYLFVIWRIARHTKMLRQQLPAFIDQIIRTLSVGRSFDNALLQAIETSPPPLSEALKGVAVENSLGGDLTQALGEAAKIYGMKELHLLTLALRINQRYGGSIKAMLENIITLIRQREQAERELRALTGETRLSAWVLGAMPSAMAGYMMIVNPSYLGYLLKDPDGPAIIYTALGLQATGVLILWRMMRAIR
jgi:tight adherence protein B